MGLKDVTCNEFDYMDVHDSGAKQAPRLGKTKDQNDPK